MDEVLLSIMDEAGITTRMDFKNLTDAQK